MSTLESQLRIFITMDSFSLHNTRLYTSRFLDANDANLNSLPGRGRFTKVWGPSAGSSPGATKQPSEGSKFRDQCKLPFGGKYASSRCNLCWWILWCLPPACEIRNQHNVVNIQCWLDFQLAIWATRAYTSTQSNSNSSTHEPIAAMVLNPQQ